MHSKMENLKKEKQYIEWNQYKYRDISWQACRKKSRVNQTAGKPRTQRHMQDCA